MFLILKCFQYSSYIPVVCEHQRHLYLHFWAVRLHFAIYVENNNLSLTFLEKR